MKKIALLIFSISVVLASCKNDTKNNDANWYKTGKFEIPEGKGYAKTTIIRTDSLQIETYKSKIDTLTIVWKNNFNYTLKMVHPKTALDEEPIHVKITNLETNTYEFEAVIGHSNYVQKGKLIKISN